MNGKPHGQQISRYRVERVSRLRHLQTRRRRCGQTVDFHECQNLRYFFLDGVGPAACDGPRSEKKNEFSRLFVKHDVIVARPWLRFVAAAAATQYQSWELCVLVDYKYSTPLFSVQPLTNLEKTRHPVRGSKTAVVARMTCRTQSQDRTLLGFLMHHILGEDLRTSPARSAFEYDAHCQWILVDQLDDEEFASSGVTH